MKKLRTITLAVALTTALSFGAVGAHANTVGTTTTSGVTGTSGTMGTGTTTTSGYTGSNYDATVGTGTTPTVTPFATTPTVTPIVTPNTYSRYGTDGVRGQINTYGNNMMDRMSTTGTNTGRYDTSSYRTYATTPATTRNMSWGWLGLIGLIGLAGLRGNNKRRDESYK